MSAISYVHTRETSFAVRMKDSGSLNKLESDIQRVNHSWVTWVDTGNKVGKFAAYALLCIPVLCCYAIDYLSTPTKEEQAKIKQKTQEVKTNLLRDLKGDILRTAKLTSSTFTDIGLTAKQEIWAEIEKQVSTEDGRTDLFYCFRNPEQKKEAKKLFIHPTDQTAEDEVVDETVEGALNQLKSLYETRLNEKLDKLFENVSEAFNQDPVQTLRFIDSLHQGAFVYPMEQAPEVLLDSGLSIRSVHVAGSSIGFNFDLKKKTITTQTSFAISDEEGKVLSQVSVEERLDFKVGSTAMKLMFHLDKSAGRSSAANTLLSYLVARSSSTKDRNWESVQVWE